jgi:DNA-directed RNA polymerase specialized sigma24 family protein
MSDRPITDEDFRDLHDRFAKGLMAVVLGKLWGDRDAEDVVQSVWASYAANHHRKAPGGTEADVWRCLLKVALKHCDKHIKRTSRGRKAGRVAVPFSTFEPQGFDVEDPNPDPDQDEVALKECVEDFLVHLEQEGLDERERGVLPLLLAGESLQSMAAQTGLTVGRVRGVVGRIRRVAGRWAEEAS